jgi:hypothetical protein
VVHGSAEVIGSYISCGFYAARVIINVSRLVVVTFQILTSQRLDDIQDGSSLRRGKPAVHEVFGVGQTINSACFQINNTLCLIQQLSPSAISIFTGRNSWISQRICF